ncbi:pyridoxal phosphate-dependent aminotransferase [Leucothrix arctica]|uniref:pyridoxal phosphate-dependent aminotransferase n=1 Tax=Leucothrix arctica TaxID=1481894 RepID=UPI001304969B|nr:pyridoxal phosphate-dependent aminotransferase [Leucothrix arctica]
MRQNLLRADNKLLNYPIREVVTIGKQLEKLGNLSMVWENIGDPITAGEQMPEWIKEIVRENSVTDKVFAYTDTRGYLPTREFVLKNFSNEKICTVDDILFFNGLGEAINKVINNLPREARILVPSPTYPSHATAEAMHAGCSFISYNLDPENDWEPNLEEIENKVKYNDHVVAILVINPNNPTGRVFKRETLEAIVKIAKDHDCFLIFDEIYHSMVFDGVENVLLHEIIGDVPGISMKGISKDVPWPGSRCGWIEVYNSEKDAEFHDFINMILLAKMLEVCSTTLPQMVLPHIYSSPKFKDYLQGRIEKYHRRAEQAVAFFEQIPQVRVSMPGGVFYFVVQLLDLPRSQLSATTKASRLYLNELLSEKLVAPDFQFTYELMASEAICVVPLSGFGSSLNGFRMTLLQEDDEVFTETLEALGRGITKYYANA